LMMGLVMVTSFIWAHLSRGQYRQHGKWHQLTEADAVVIHRPATLLVAHIPLHSSAV
jgi:hypothetical protein